MNRFDQSKHDKEDDNNARGNCTKQSKILGKFSIDENVLDVSLRITTLYVPFAILYVDFIEVNSQCARKNDLHIQININSTAVAAWV